MWARWFGLQKQRRGASSALVYKWRDAPLMGYISTSDPPVGEAQDFCHTTLRRFPVFKTYDHSTDLSGVARAMLRYRPCTVSSNERKGFYFC